MTFFILNYWDEEKIVENFLITYFRSKIGLF